MRGEHVKIGFGIFSPFQRDTRRAPRSKKGAVCWTIPAYGALTTDPRSAVPVKGEVEGECLSYAQMFKHVETGGWPNPVVGHLKQFQETTQQLSFWRRSICKIGLLGETCALHALAVLVALALVPVPLRMLTANTHARIQLPV